MGLRGVLCLLLAAVPLGLAHPHPDGTPLKMSKRTLSHCDAGSYHADFEARSIERRSTELRRLRKERGIPDGHIIHGRDLIGRDYRDVLAKDHKSKQNVTAETPDSEIFAGAGNCVMTPEVTEGPLYVRGEEVRRELTEGETGVKMTIDIQVVDVNTCKPIENVAVDFWSCNSTGVYGGVLNYPGNGDPNDLSLINTTTLRGVQFTNADGAAAFDTVVPGHYAGRANHVHAIAHIGAKQQANGTITGGTVSHIGQIYFDQSLLDQVEKVPPYAGNTQAWTKNAQDFLFMQGSTTDDPVVEYVLVGGTVADGIFAWIRFGVDPTASRPLSPAAYYDEHGGHQLASGFPGVPPVGGGGGFGGGWGGGGWGGIGRLARRWLGLAQEE